MFSCLLCKIDFPSQQSRRRHYNDNRAHTSELKCKTCQSSYATLHLYYTHMTMDHSEKFCVYCLEEFKSYRDLRLHEAHSQEHQNGTLNINNVNSPPNLNVISRPSMNSNDNNILEMSDTARHQIVDIRGAASRHSSSREVANNLRSQTARRAQIIRHHRQVEPAIVHGVFLHPEWDIWPGLPVDNQTERTDSERPTPIRDTSRSTSIEVEVELESPRAQVAGSEITVPRGDHAQRQSERRRSSFPGAYEFDDSLERTESDSGHDTGDATIIESANANEGAEISTTCSSWWPSFLRFPRISLPYCSPSTGRTNTAQTPPVDETSARSAYDLSNPDTDRLEISQSDPELSSSGERRGSPTLTNVDRRSDSVSPADNDDTSSPNEINDSSLIAENEANGPNETRAPTSSVTLDSSHESSGSLKCRICLELETDVSALNCGHVLGTTCIEKYLAYHPDGGCPFCRRPIVQSDIRRLFLSA